MPGRLHFALAVLFAATAACAHRGGTAADSKQLGPQEARVSVNVTNNYQSAMEIFVLGNGTSHHLGTVAPGVPRSFELRPGMVAAGGHVQVLAPASAPRPPLSTPELIVPPRDAVDFR